MSQKYNLHTKFSQLHIRYQKKIKNFCYGFKQKSMAIQLPYGYFILRSRQNRRERKAK